MLEYEADEGNDVQEAVVPIPGILSYQLYCFIVNFIQKIWIQTNITLKNA